jgi:hypothetical protein
MPSLVTSVIGGIQGASASHHAADYLQQGYKQAGQTVNDAVSQVNPDILKTAADAGAGVSTAANTAGQGMTTAAGAAGTGATTAAERLTGMLDPYISMGSTAAGQLGDASKPFTADMMAKYSPAYQFQLQQGLQGAARAAAAGGMTGSGGTMKSLSRYAQDYAGTAFKNANDIYNQNFSRLATLADMGRGAATTAGQAGLQASEYAGTAGMQGAEYAGNAGMRGAEYAGNANINARNLASSNTLSGANYLANTQIGSQQARASGDLGAASAWNGMLGGIGAAANTAVMGGFGADGGWSFSNIGKNIGSSWGKK